MRTWILCVVVTAAVWSPYAAAQTIEPPLADKYLVTGKLQEGEQALLERLKEAPADDQARFGLAMLQFVRTFERLTSNVYQCGLRSDEILRFNPELRRFFRDTPKPKLVAYADIRKLIQTFLDDLATIEANLALIKDADVKLPIHVGRIRVNPFNESLPVSAAFLLRGTNDPERDENFVIAFDRGDVDWLRGYCHFLAAIGELLLTVDGQEVFDCSAHLFLKAVETPHKFLTEERLPIDDNLLISAWSDPRVLFDAVSFVHHMLRLPLKEPDRAKVALAHLEAMIVHGKAQWKFIRSEKDDDREWIPNPNQKSVTQVPVTDEIIEAWLATLEEADQVLKGKKLIPFWRGTKKRGINLRRVFTEPRTFDLVEWVQGTGATPYLEEGPLTEFANEQFVDRTFAPFDTPFGFAGFAFWFN
jgi:hypothetical protein